MPVVSQCQTCKKPVPWTAVPDVEAWVKLNTQETKAVDEVMEQINEVLDEDIPEDFDMIKSNRGRKRKVQFDVEEEKEKEEAAELASGNFDLVAPSDSEEEEEEPPINPSQDLFEPSQETREDVEDVEAEGPGRDKEVDVEIVCIPDTDPDSNEVQVVSIIGREIKKRKKGPLKFVECAACDEGQANQLAHIGGCIKDPEEEELEKIEKMAEEDTKKDKEKEVDVVDGIKKGDIVPFVLKHLWLCIRNHLMKKGVPEYMGIMQATLKAIFFVDEQWISVAVAREKYEALMKGGTLADMPKTLPVKSKYYVG